MLFVIVIAGIGGLIFIFSQLFIIKNIKCQSQYGPCSQLVEEAIKSAQGKYYFSAKAQIDKLLGQESLVKSYSVKLYNLHQLEVNVVERKAIAVVGREGNLGELFGIDEEEDE